MMQLLADSSTTSVLLQASVVTCEMGGWARPTVS